MSVNKYEVQKMYDAAKGVTLETASKNDPFLSFNDDAKNPNIIFKNEYDHRMFLVGLKAPQIEEAIKAIDADKVGLSTTEKTEYLAVLKKMQAEIQTIQGKAYSELERMSFVIKGLIPKVESVVAPVNSAPATVTTSVQAQPPASKPVALPSLVAKPLETVDNSEQMIKQVAVALKIKKGVTKQVQNNADKIKAELLSGKNKVAIIPAIKILLDGAKSNQDFQRALGMPTSGEKPADGTIGMDTINILLEKVGSNYRLEAPVKVVKDTKKESRPVASAVKTVEVPPVAAKATPVASAPVSPISVPAPVVSAPSPKPPASGSAAVASAIPAATVAPKPVETKRELKEILNKFNGNNVLKSVDDKTMWLGNPSDPDIAKIQSMRYTTIWGEKNKGIRPIFVYDNKMTLVASFDLSAEKNRFNETNPGNIGLNDIPYIPTITLSN